MRFALLVLLTACRPEVTGVDSAGGGAVDGPAVVVATVDELYSVGALAAVSLEDWAVADQLVDISGDPAVAASGGLVFQLDRFGFDTVRIYEPGQWASPRAELALDDLANPHDVEVCAGKAFISQYGASSLAVVDPETGAVLGAVDLSAHADADGLPEASTMELGSRGRLYVGLHALDRSDTPWVSAGGAVVEVDCEAEEVSRSWEVASPDVFAAPGQGGELIVHELDSGLRRLDTEAGELSELLVDHEELGGRVLGLAAWGDAAVLTVFDEDGRHAIGCLELGDTWSYAEVERPGNYLVTIAGNDRGEAWIGARTHWGDEGEAPPNGLIVYDIEECASLTAGKPVATVLAPYSLAFY